MQISMSICFFKKDAQGIVKALGSRDRSRHQERFRRRGTTSTARRVAAQRPGDLTINHVIHNFLKGLLIFVPHFPDVFQTFLTGPGYRYGEKQFPDAARFPTTGRQIGFASNDFDKYEAGSGFIRLV
jgi:hypothetical protein